MDTSGLQFFTGYSLVDITPTGVIRHHDPDNIERNQQRNWETVLQCLNLRTQPLYIHTPRLLHFPGEGELCDLDFLYFGDFYSGHHKVWTWSWAIEAKDVYDLPGKPMGGIHADFEQVPIITYLTDTARFLLPIFYPYGSIRNIYFEQIHIN